MGNPIRELIYLKKMIAASLYLEPCSLNELMDRDFLKNRSPEGIDRLLHQMEQKNWIYYRYGRYYTYKKFALSSEMSDFELV